MLKASVLSHFPLKASSLVTVGVLAFQGSVAPGSEVLKFQAVCLWSWPPEPEGFQGPALSLPLAWPWLCFIGCLCPLQKSQQT